LETIRQPVADAWFEVIGVAGDARNQGPLEPVLPAIWIPFTVTPMSSRSILVRTANDPNAMLNTLRREVWGVDRGVALTGATSLEDYMNQNTYAQPRFTFLLLAVFAVAGLALAMVGVYGTMAYVTARQTQEIGIRMALGADRGAVRGMVMRSGLKLVGGGILIGLATTLLLGRVIASLLWGISPYDPATLIAVPVLLALTGLAACWRPARRATLVDPAVCLRCD
jgi:putative ABC transport system permease protein